MLALTSELSAAPASVCGVGKNRDSRPISDFGIDDCSSVVNSFDRGIKFIAADADDEAPRTSESCLRQQTSTSFISVDGYAEENISEFNCTHWLICNQ